MGFRHVLLLAALGCAHAAPAPAPPSEPVAEPTAAPPQETWSTLAQEPAEVRRDLADVERAGVLRVLVHGEEGVPRVGSPQDRALARVGMLARALDLRVRFVRVPEFGVLIDALMEGHGDLIAAQLTDTPARRQRVRFSTPLRYVEELVVAPREAAEVPESVDQLAGARIWVRPSSSFRTTLDAVTARLDPPPQLEDVPESIDEDAILYRVGTGEYALSVADSDAVASYLAYRSDVRVAFAIRDRAPIAWAVRPGAHDLLAAVDTFLEGSGSEGAGSLATGLEAVRARGVLRVVMPNNASSYFFYRGMPMGFHYTMAQKLAAALGVRLQVVVPRRLRDMIPLLLQGHADVIAPALTRTPERAEHVQFSEPLLHVPEVLVQPASEPPITRVDELAGRTVHVRRSSSYWETLSRLQATVPDLELVAAPAELETEELIAQVARGEIPMTVADYNILAVELSFREDVQGSLKLTRGRPHAYAVAKDAPALLDAVNRFVARHRSQAADKRSLDPTGARRADGGGGEVPPAPKGALSPYDELIQRLAEPYGIDWRLVVAQVAEESGFRPGATDWLGSRGLLQVMPAVAERMGFDPAALSDPEVGLRAGLQALAGLYARFRDTVDTESLPAVTLAAWRAGAGHVVDAQRIARAEGLDPRRWEGNIARAFKLLARREVAAATRYGYCRADEVLRYVEAVLDRHAALEP